MRDLAWAVCFQPRQQGRGTDLAGLVTARAPPLSTEGDEHHPPPVPPAPARGGRVHRERIDLAGLAPRRGTGRTRNPGRPATRVRISASAGEEMRTMAKILVVEDADDNRDMLSRRLQRKGHRVVQAADGQEAVDMATRERPDLILMDVSLPVMDGLEATRRIKARTETQTTPIIAVTAHAMSGDRDKALRAGCDDYHAKPVELPRLVAQMEALLAKEATA